MASIVIPGLASSDAVPGSYISVDFAQGQASTGTAVYGAIIMANKSTAGSATVDTTVYSQTSTTPLSTENDAIALFGAGSPAHRMWRQFVAVNKTTPVSVICPAASAGAAATGTITYTGTATSSGVTRVYVGEGFVERSITTGDTPTVTAAAVATLINAQTAWPATASAAIGVVTLTWKTAGPRGNSGQYSATIQTATGQTVTPGASTYFTGGTTVDSNANALATLLPYRYYYIISEASDATNFGALVMQVNTQAMPITGIRQRAFCASVDTLANTTTLATGFNAARAELVWSQDNNRPPEELAATAAGIYALSEQPTSFRCNFSGYGNDATTSQVWNVKAPRIGTAPTRANILSALQNGITPIGVNANGSTYLVKRITTRSLIGAVNDYRIRDAHKVTVMDRFADDLNTKIALQFQGKKIGDDPIPGARVPGADVVTPRVFKAAIVKLLGDYLDIDLVQSVPATIAAMVVQRETSPTTRMSAMVPIYTVDIADQFGVLAEQSA